MRYYFLNNLLLRSPAYSYGQYAIEKAGEVIKDPFFQLALYLASPQLYHILKAKNWEFESLSAKEQSGILRYYNRMSFRPTPFGSFSSFSLAEWGPGEQLILSGLDAKLHLHLDQDIVLCLAERLTGNDLNKYQFSCNPSLYKSKGAFRFIKTTYTGEKGGALFDLESYECNTLTTSLIDHCRNTLRYGNEIIAFVIKMTANDRKTAADYLNFLVDAQIIIPATGMNMIGDDYLQRLLANPGIAGHPFQQNLQAVYRQLHTITARSVIQLTSISEQLAALVPDHQFAKTKPLFYAGLEKKVVKGSVAHKYRSQILEGLHALRHLALPAQPLMLQQFIRDFKKRYDRRKISLLEAIDPETGIGYGSLTEPPDQTELLRAVNFRALQNTNTQLEWSDAHRRLLGRWNENGRSDDPIVLSDADIAAVAGAESLPSPPTLSVLFRIIDDEVLFLETVGGVSGTALAGRFTAWSGDLHALSRDIAAKEQSANPEVIFADIGQLSDTHADNINRRQHSYDYEIPVNVVSTLPLTHQIALSDLWLSVTGTELILESALHKKVIVPRLSSAYNYSRNHLAVFRLLCDLQYQGLQANYTLELEHYFPGMPHYPRVVFKNTILCPATWHLTGDELDELKSSGEAITMDRFKSIRASRRIPAIVALTRFDQQLIFNLEQEEEIRLLVQCLRGLDKAILKESFLPEKSVVINGDGLPLINQLVAFLYQKEQVYSGYRLTDTVVVSKVNSEFIIGSKWLYLKLYCNPAFANELLTKKLIPFFNEADQGEIISWFFIRFRDAGYHIRLRLKVKTASIGPILSLLKKRLTGSVHYQLIRDYQADTYRREMERYGPDSISLVEDFFYGSSELVLRYIKLSGLKSFRHSYHSLGFVSVDYLLSSFLPEIHLQLPFLEQLVNTFYTEFSNDKSLKIDLDLKYRGIRSEIIGLLSDPDYYEKLKLMEWQELFKSKTRILLKATAGFPVKRRHQLLADLIHMHLNRLFVDRQRNQELVIYYCLYKYKLSRKAIAHKH